MSDKKKDKKLDKKTSALLALEAKMIEKDQEVYTLENYITDMFSEIEEVLLAENPERLLDEVELKTFQSLIQEHISGERRKSADRRVRSSNTAEEKRKNTDRRWKGKPRSVSSD